MTVEESQEYLPLGHHYTGWGRSRHLPGPSQVRGLSFTSVPSSSLRSCGSVAEGDWTVRIPIKTVLLVGDRQGPTTCVLGKVRNFTGKSVRFGATLCPLVRRTWVQEGPVNPQNPTRHPGLLRTFGTFPISPVESGVSPLVRLDCVHPPPRVVSLGGDVDDRCRTRI